METIMLKILFSPSEDKSLLSPMANSLENSLCFGKKFETRKKCIELYNDILRDKDEQELSKLFGLKNQNEIDKFAPIEYQNSSLQKAVLRYIGVAYAHLKYQTLDKKAQEFIDKNTLIFSNLFGPILAGDSIPYYKLKQGENLRDFDTAAYYKNAFTNEIDKWLEGAFIVDLRAAFYERFYIIKQPHISMKFYKNGKIASHFAKVYRGIALRDLAIHGPQNSSDFERINFKNLHIRDIKHIGKKSEYSFEIADKS
jgi:cytoplasmic iron level regulating protein YaaA (DUF328/UPF0246 family)